MHYRRYTLTLLGLLIWVGCRRSGSSSNPPPPPPPPESAVELEFVAGGFSRPVFLESPTDDPRLFIVEQRGVIWIIENGQTSTLPFLDIEDRVMSGGEQGLLSMAFHPEFEINGRFFVCYTDKESASCVEEYAVSSNPNVSEPNSQQLILTVEQPYSNHNGGLIAFGPDGYLYIGLGDGGSGGDPDSNGQNIETLLGSLLRIDINRSLPYDIPPDNPFVGSIPGLDEIWIYGLRNPWRFAFDRVANLLFIADVGQSSFEEISVVSSLQGGWNLGWNLMEGPDCFGPNDCDPTGLVLPSVFYLNDEEGCSVIGGFVYRGSEVPSAVGHYFYSDLCSGFLRSIRVENGIAVEETQWLDDIGTPLSFGVDSNGELYVLLVDGRVLRMIASD